MEKWNGSNTLLRHMSPDTNKNSIKAFNELLNVEWQVIRLYRSLYCQRHQENVHLLAGSSSWTSQVLTKTLITVLRETMQHMVFKPEVNVQQALWERQKTPLQSSKYLPYNQKSITSGVNRGRHLVKTHRNWQK